MIEKVSEVYTLIHFVKTIIMNICIYYSFNKITPDIPNNKKNTVIFMFFNLLISSLYTLSEYKINSILSLLIMYVLVALFFVFFTKNKTGYSLIVTIISYAICNISLLFSVIINFIPYNLIYKNNYYLNLASVLALQYIFVYLFFKIKRFSKGFAFLHSKLNNDITDMIIIFISIGVMLITAFMGTLYQGYKSATQDIFIIFLFLAITMVIIIQKMLTMHYKQTQLLKTMEEYKNDILNKDKEIEKLSKEKFNTSKIRHEFYHRQKALELLVKENMSRENDTTNENVSPKVLEIINSLTNEYSKECEKIKQLSELDKTGIVEIDTMFKYMQKECYNNDIEFKLKILGNIYPLVNNGISKSRLETLIGDHIKDAINAVNNEGVNNKEILAILGMKDSKYELSIHDTGIEFEVDTLLKLGEQTVTTCANKGGSGIGFLTTFETMNETKASLIIMENKPSNEMYYTKSITIRFDEKHEYIIRSYRAEEIRKNNNSKRIIIEEIK